MKFSRIVGDDQIFSSDEGSKAKTIGMNYNVLSKSRLVILIVAAVSSNAIGLLLTKVF